MKRPGDGVITAMKAMLPVVFTLRCLSFGSQMGAEVPRPPVPLSAFGFDQMTLSESTLVRNRRTDETIVRLDH